MGRPRGPRSFSPLLGLLPLILPHLGCLALALPLRRRPVEVLMTSRCQKRKSPLMFLRASESAHDGASVPRNRTLLRSWCETSAACLHVGGLARLCRAGLKREIPGMQGFPCIEPPPKFDSESFNTSANTSAICAICVHIPAKPRNLHSPRVPCYTRLIASTCRITCRMNMFLALRVRHPAAPPARHRSHTPARRVIRIIRIIRSYGHTAAWHCATAAPARH